MLLSPGLLTSTAQVLTLSSGQTDLLGHAINPAWADDGPPVPCAHFPAGAKIVTQAQLKAVKVSREVYLGRLGLNPQTNRLRIDGTVYAITLVNDWDQYAQVGVVTP